MLHPKYLLDTTYTHPKNPVFDKSNMANPHDLVDDQKALDLISLAPGPFPYRWLKTGDGARTDYFGLYAADSTYNDNEYAPEYNDIENQIARQKALFHIYGDSEKLSKAVINTNSRRVMAETRLAVGKILQVDSPKDKDGYTMALYEQLYRDLRIAEAQEKFKTHNPLLVSAKTHLKIGKLFRQDLHFPELGDSLDFSLFRQSLYQNIQNLASEPDLEQCHKVTQSIDALVEMTKAGLNKISDLPNLDDLEQIETRHKTRIKALLEEKYKDCSDVTVGS